MRPDAITAATLTPATLGASLLTSAASEAARARDLLELAGCADAHTLRRLWTAIETLNAVRLITDAQLDLFRAAQLGRDVPGDALELLELGRAQLSE